MKTEKAVILTVLVCASLVFSYWLGFQNGRRPPTPPVTPQTTAVKTDTPPQNVLVDLSALSPSELESLSNTGDGSRILGRLLAQKGYTLLPTLLTKAKWEDESSKALLLDSAAAKGLVFIGAFPRNDPQFSYLLWFARKQNTPDLPRTVVQAATREPVAVVAKGPFTYAPRDPAAKPQHIDLTKHYNASLSNVWHSTYAGNDLASVPTGLQSFDGTDFDVRGLIQLRGPFEGSELYPPKIESIRLGMRSQKLHFLHNACGSSTARSATKGEVIGSYIVHYADNETVSVPIRFGENIVDWWATSGNMPRPAEAVVVWEGTNQASANNNRKVIITKFSWDNPRPDVEMQSLDFVAEGVSATPFLIAITAEP